MSPRFGIDAPFVGVVVRMDVSFNLLTTATGAKENMSDVERMFHKRQCHVTVQAKKNHSPRGVITYGNTLLVMLSVSFEQ